MGGGAAAASTAATSAWPEALHDSAHSATASVTGPSTGRVEWTRSLGGNITPGPVVAADGTIYVATNAGVLHALNPTTGADLWTFDGGGPYTGETDLSTSPLVLPQGSILWPGPADTLYELSLPGKVLWSHRFDGMVLSPALAGTSVYVGLMSGTVWELNVSGTLPVLGWSTSIGHSSFGSPAVGPDGDVITTVDKSVVALAGATGAVQWRYTASATIEVSPSVGATGDVYITANDGSVYELRPDGSLDMAQTHRPGVLFLLVGQPERASLLRRQQRGAQHRAVGVGRPGEDRSWSEGRCGRLRPSTTRVTCTLERKERGSTATPPAGRQIFHLRASGPSTHTLHSGQRHAAHRGRGGDALCHRVSGRDGRAPAHLGISRLEQVTTKRTGRDSDKSEQLVAVGRRVFRSADSRAEFKMDTGMGWFPSARSAWDGC